MITMYFQIQFVSVDWNKDFIYVYPIYLFNLRKALNKNSNGKILLFGFEWFIARILFHSLVFAFACVVIAKQIHLYLNATIIHLENWNNFHFLPRKNVYFLDTRGNKTKWNCFTFCRTLRTTKTQTKLKIKSKNIHFYNWRKRIFFYALYACDHVIGGDWLISWKNRDRKIK